MRQHALDIAQDALNGRQVLFARVVDVKTHLLNDIGDVRAREGEVLESPGETPVLSWVGHGRAGRSGELGRRVDRCRGRLADSHAGVVQNLRCILGLREVHAGGVAGNRDAKKVVEAAHVHHGKLGAEGGGDSVEKPGRGGGEDDVIDIQQEESCTLRALKDKQGRVGA
jgi:hypothetical protein